MLKPCHRNIFLLVALWVSNAAVAQVPFKHWTMSIGAGASRYMGTIPQSNFSYAFLFDVEHFLSRQWSLSFEWQTDKLSGGSQQNDPFGRTFESNLNAGLLVGKLYLAKFDDQVPVSRLGRFLANTYLGLGIGLGASQITSINRWSKQGERLYGQDQTVTGLLSINLGSNIDFSNKLRCPIMYLNLNCQFNMTSTDQLDGYAVPVVISRAGYDSYFISSLKLGVYIGVADFFYKHHSRFN